MPTGNLELDGVMRILEQEVEARELTSTTRGPTPSHKMQAQMPTGATLLTTNSESSNIGPSCVYCGWGHASTSCTTITNVTACKDVLCKAGRCYVCLQKSHQRKNCCSGSSCVVCRGRHHVIICYCQNLDQGSQPPPVHES